MAARAKEKSNNNDKLEADALRLAKDAAIGIIDLITNNQSFVDAAFEAAAAEYDQDNKEEQRQMNNSKGSQREIIREKNPLYKAGLEVKVGGGREQEDAVAESKNTEHVYDTNNNDLATYSSKKRVQHALPRCLLSFTKMSSETEA